MPVQPSHLSNSSLASAARSERPRFSRSDLVSGSGSGSVSGSGAAGASDSRGMRRSSCSSCSGGGGRWKACARPALLFSAVGARSAMRGSGTGHRAPRTLCESNRQTRRVPRETAESLALSSLRSSLTAQHLEKVAAKPPRCFPPLPASPAPLPPPQLRICSVCAPQPGCSRSRSPHGEQQDAASSGCSHAAPRQPRLSISFCLHHLSRKCCCARGPGGTGALRPPACRIASHGAVSAAASAGASPCARGHRSRLRLRQGGADDRYRDRLCVAGARGALPSRASPSSPYTSPSSSATSRSARRWATAR